MRKSIGFLTTVFLVLLLACPSNAGKIYPLGSSSASGIYFDNSTASLTDDPPNVQKAIEALKTEMGSLEAGGLADLDDLPGDDTDNNLIDKDIIQDSANWDTAYGWGNHASGGYESHTSNDIDVDRLAGDTTDDNLLDNALLPANISVTSVTATGAAGLITGVAGSVQGNVKFYSNTAGNNFYGSIFGANFTENVGLRLPASMPAGNNYLINLDPDGTMDTVDPATFQPAGAKLSAIQALASSSGYLKNDGSGNFSYDTPEGGGGLASTDIDTESELEAIMSGINLIVSTEIDSTAELNALLGVTISTSGHTHDYQASSALLSGIAGTTPSAGYLHYTGAAYEWAEPTVPTASSLHIDDILTAIGIASEAVHLGTFTGSTIADSSTAKAALQALETAVEGKQASDADLGTLAAPTAWRVFYSNGSSAITELALGADGTYLRSNGASSAPTFDTPTGAAHDAVSLAASAAVLLNLSTQEVSLDTQTANYVFAGPASGAAAAPTFRALSADDLPDLSSVYTTSGHTHTGSDLSGIDISDDTNLAGTTNEITLTGDTLSLATTLDLSGKTLTMPSSFTQAAVASPAQTFYDSDAPGSEAADKMVAQFWGEYVDGNEDAEDASGGMKVMINGTLADMIWYGHAADVIFHARAAVPSTSDGAALGSATYEWSDLYLANGGVIYGQADQSNTLTSSATGWTANLAFTASGILTASTAINLTGANTSPSATAGQIRYDSTITGVTNGAITWFDGTGVRQFVDLDTTPSNDDYVVSYDADADKFYMKADATGAGGSGSMTTVKEADSQVGGADIVTLDFGAGFDLAESPDTEVQITLDLTEYTGAIAGSAITLTGADTSPDAAGMVRFDSTVTGLATGALAWYDGDEVRYLVDLDVLPSNDDYVVAYDADNDNFYMKADATGGAGTPAGDGTPDGQLQYANDANDAMTAEDALYYEADTNTLYVDNITYTGVITGPAGTDPYTYYNETDGTDWWTGVDDTGNSFEWRTNATVGNSVHLELEEDGDLVVGGDLTATGNDIVLGTAAAGVTITGDGDGSLEIHGFGDGSDENLVINLDDTADTASISSDTGVVTIALGSIGMTTSGPIEITDATTGLIIRDTEGQRYRITVSTAGVLTATEL